MVQGLSSRTSSHNTPGVVRTSAPLYSAQLPFTTEVFEHQINTWGQVPVLRNSPSMADTFPPADCQNAWALQEGVAVCECL